MTKRSSDRKTRARQILKSLNIHPGLDEIGDGDDLFASGLLDSLVVVQYVMALEDEFGVEFLNSEITYRNFKDFETIALNLDQKAKSRSS